MKLRELIAGVPLTGGSADLEMEIYSISYDSRTLEPGALFGAAALFHRRARYETTITALCPCAVAFFPEEQVIGLLSGDRTLCANYIRYLSERIHFLSRKVESLPAPGPAEKLSRCLLESAGDDGRLCCSATELSRRLDMSRASLYRAFQTLEEAGAIRREGKTIVILDRRVLEHQNGVLQTKVNS